MHRARRNLFIAVLLIAVVSTGVLQQPRVFAAAVLAQIVADTVDDFVLGQVVNTTVSNLQVSSAGPDAPGAVQLAQTDPGPTYISAGSYVSRPYTPGFTQATLREIRWSAQTPRGGDVDTDIAVDYRTSASDCANLSASNWVALDAPGDSHRSNIGQNAVPIPDQPVQCFQFRADLTTTNAQQTPALLNVGIVLAIPGAPDLQVSALAWTGSGLQVSIRNQNAVEPTLPADVNGAGSFFADLFVFEPGQPVTPPILPLTPDNDQGSKAYATVTKSTMQPGATLGLTGWRSTANDQPIDLASLFTKPGVYTVIVAVDSYGFVDENSPGGENNNLLQVSFVPLPGSSGTPNLFIGGIEVTQAIQAPGNPVPLVAKRTAMARVFVGLQGAATELGGVTARLHILRNGVEISGSPLAPMNAASFRARAIPDAARLDDTLNFLVPRDWLTSGALTFRAEVNPDRTLTETTYDDNRSADLALPVGASRILDLVAVPIAYQRNGQGPTYRIDLLADQSWRGKLHNMYPVSTVGALIHSEVRFTGDLNTPQGWSDLLRQIGELRARERGGAPLLNNAAALPKYYAVVPAAGLPLGGAGQIVGVGYVGGPVAAGRSGLDEVAPHELGHTFGLRHAPCGGPADVDPAFPNPNGQIGDVGVDVTARTVLPATTADFMSYCSPEWISRYHYTRLVPLLRSYTSSAASARAIQSVTNGVLISGQIDGDTARIDAVEPISTTSTVAAPGAGDYRIRLLDGSDVELFAYAFEPATIDIESAAGIRAATFSFAAPDSPGLASVELWRGGDRLAVAAVTNEPPQLSAGLAEVNPSVPTLRSVMWQASGGGGAAIRIAVRYSHDRGVSWQTLGVGLPGSALTFDTAQLPASANGLLEVTASVIGAARSVRLDLGPIANKPPVVAVAADQPIGVPLGESLALLAVVSDVEDGILPDAALVWRDEDGTILGTGPELILSSTAFGRHALTLTATDSAGAEGRTTVVVLAGEYVYLPLIR